MNEIPRVSGVLGGLSVLASALLLELGRNLVMNSFGEGADVQALASGLRWLAVFVIVLAVLYTAYRFTADRRSGARLAARRSLLAGLDAPPPAGPEAAAARELASAPGTDPGLFGALSTDERQPLETVAAALRELPVFDFDAATLHAILTGMSIAPVSAPRAVGMAGAHSPARAEPWTAVEMTARLVRHGVLECYAPQRYRIAKASASPTRSGVLADGLWHAGLFALVSHTAGRAEGWAAGSTTVAFGSRARRWFAVEERWLRAIVATCCADEGEHPGAGVHQGSRGPGTGCRISVAPAVAAELARIGDALDSWYALRPDGGGARARAVAAELEKLGPAKLGSRYRGIEIRAGADPEHAADRADIPRRRPPWRRTSGVGARAEYERALTLLNATDDPDAVPQAVERLRKAWWRLPRADAANQVRVLTALAVAYIRQGRLDAAQDRLELAALRARDAGDDDGWARAQELTAVVHWTRGEPRAALRCWQRALTIYRDLSDADGIGRTLHNIGAAALKAPEHGDLLLGGVEAPAAMEVLRYAHSWLAEAARRDPAPASARQYTVDAAAARGGAVAPPMGRWPLEVRDVGGPDPG